MTLVDTVELSTLKHIERRKRIVATRGAVPYQFVGNGVPSARSDTRSETRIQVKFGPSDVSEVQLIYGNYADVAQTDGQTDGANDITIQGAIEEGGISFEPSRLNGDKTPVLKPGALVEMDPFGISPAADSTWMIRSGCSVGAGETMPSGTRLLRTNSPADTGWLSSSGSSQVHALGTMTDPGSGLSQGGFGPLAIIGVPATPHHAVINYGDSNQFGSGESGANVTGDLDGNIGFVARGLYDVDGHSIPSVMLSRGGKTMQQGRWERVDSNSPGDYLNHYLFRYATRIISDLGNNDINGALGARTLLEIQTDALAAWAQWRRAGLAITMVTVPPRTTSTSGNWTSAGDQTYSSANFTPGGMRDLWNAWLLTQVGSTIDEVFDINLYVEDQAAPCKWKSDGTNKKYTLDGVHLSSFSHAAAGVGITALAAAWPEAK